MEQLATQGTGWFLFVALLGFTGWLLKQHLDLLKANAKLAEVVALALRESGEANGTLAQSVKDRTPAFDSLSQVVMQQTRDYETNNRAWEGWASRHDAATKEIHEEQIEVRRLLDKREGRG
jgi:hypothetical protein